MRSQEKLLINAKLTRSDGYVSYGQILPEEEKSLKAKGTKVEHITAAEVKRGKHKELKGKFATKEQK